MFFLFVVLKVPILAACWLVWYAVRAVPDPSEEDATGDEGGGAKTRPHPAPRLPHAPRRGPHGDPAPLPPPRVRRLTVRGRVTHR